MSRDYPLFRGRIALVCAAGSVAIVGLGVLFGRMVKKEGVMKNKDEARPERIVETRSRWVFGIVIALAVGLAIAGFLFWGNR